jgi:hypothetical protein
MTNSGPTTSLFAAAGTGSGGVVGANLIVSSITVSSTITVIAAGPNDGIFFTTSVSSPALIVKNNVATDNVKVLSVIDSTSGGGTTLPFLLNTLLLAPGIGVGSVSLRRTDAGDAVLIKPAINVSSITVSSINGGSINGGQLTGEDLILTDSSKMSTLTFSSIVGAGGYTISMTQLISSVTGGSF